MCQPWEREREDKCNNNNVTMLRDLGIIYPFKILNEGL